MMGHAASWKVTICVLLLVNAGILSTASARSELRAGAAKVDITNREVGPANDTLYAKALVLKNGATTTVIVTVDAVAIGEIGGIGNTYLPNVRRQLEKELGISPNNVLINASHCHGIVCADVEQKTIQAVREASQRLEPVSVGVGRGREDRIMENRRLRLKNGREADVRHAYAMPADDEVAEVGPIDPEIGILRLDRMNGQTLAIVYNFACHPIQGVPNGGNTADITGFASKVIEDSFGMGTIALFIQGCGGDINPVFYKDVDHPRDAETLGNRLGLSTMRAAREMVTSDRNALVIVPEKVELPRADLAARIEAVQAEQTRMVNSLTGSSLNLKTFMSLAVKHGLSEDFPSYYSHGYLHDKLIGRDDLSRLDAENKRSMRQYLHNIQVMEELTRLQTNLALLKKHQAQNLDAGQRTINVEVVGLRVGDFVLVTFPGELTVRIGLNIKQNSPHQHTFVAGYTNGYIYYAPTAEQLQNVGGAQEDSDCILAPEWQAIFENKVTEVLQKL